MIELGTVHIVERTTISRTFAKQTVARLLPHSVEVEDVTKATSRIGRFSREFQVAHVGACGAVEIFGSNTLYQRSAIFTLAEESIVLLLQSRRVRATGLCLESGGNLRMA